MLKLGTPIIDPEGNTGTVQRNSIKGAHMVRINDRWFVASECKRNDGWKAMPYEWAKDGS